MDEYDVDRQDKKKKALAVLKELKARVAMDKDQEECLKAYSDNALALKEALDNGWEDVPLPTKDDMICTDCGKAHHHIRLLGDFSLSWQKGRCPKCEDRRRVEFDIKLHQSLYEDVLVSAGIPSRLKDARWEHVCGHYSQAMGNADLKDHLWLCGPNRTGKTYAAVALLRKMCMEGWPIRVMRFCDLSSGAMGEAMEGFVRTRDFAGVLLLDDVKVLQGEFWTSKLDELISYRYDNCLRTILTTNVMPEDFPATFGTRVASRAMEDSIQVVFDKRRF